MVRSLVSFLYRASPCELPILRCSVATHATTGRVRRASPRDERLRGGPGGPLVERAPRDVSSVPRGRASSSRPWTMTVPAPPPAPIAAPIAAPWPQPVSCSQGDRRFAPHHPDGRGHARRACWSGAIHHPLKSSRSGGLQPWDRLQNQSICRCSPASAARSSSAEDRHLVEPPLDRGPMPQW